MRASPPAGILMVAAVGGGATMVIELAAVRLLAPWFGSSLAVWTNVICVVLLALALGYLAGGRLATRGRPLAWMGKLLFGAGLLAAVLPLLAPLICNWLMPRAVALQEAATLIGWGSLAAALTLFLPPAALLGCVSPLAVQAAVEVSGASPGRAGGWVLGAGTFGSLVGSFATSHWLVPELGLAATFWLAALTLFLCSGGAWSLGRGSRSGLGVGALLAIGVVGTSSWQGPVKRPELSEGWRELGAVESPYQSVRVVQAPDGMRFLQVNEVTDSFQSAWQAEPGLLPEGYYYNYFALPAWWQELEGSWRTVVLGLGAGTAWRVLDGALPPESAHVSLGIELDPAVVRLSERHLGLSPSDERRVLGGVDARVGLGLLADASLEQVLLDAYANQVEIPPHLCSVEFFRAVNRKLVSGGWLSVNVGSFGREDPVLEALVDTICAAFETSVLAVRVPASRNWMVYARRDRDVPPLAQLAERTRDTELARLVGPLELESARFRRSVPEGRILTDDRNGIEVLQREAIRLAGRDRHDREHR